MSNITTSPESEQEHLPEVDQAFVPLSYGAILTEARKALKLSVDDVATELQLKSQTIISLESEEPEKGVSKVFYRGYLRAYAKRLGLSPEEIVSMCEPNQNQPSVNMKSFSRKVERQTTDRRINYVSILIAVTVVLSLAFASFSEGESTQSVGERVTQFIDTTMLSDGDEMIESAENAEHINKGPEIEDDISQIPENTMISTSDKSIVQKHSERASLQVAAEQQSSARLEAEASTDSKVVSREATIFDSDPKVDNTEVFPDEVSLELSFSGDCWMELVDSTGEKVAYGIKKSGRVVKVSGIPPFQLTLGAPEFVQIIYSGETMDMTKYRPGRTARITLPLI